MLHNTNTLQQEQEKSDKDLRNMGNTDTTSTTSREEEFQAGNRQLRHLGIPEHVLEDSWNSIPEVNVNIDYAKMARWAKRTQSDLAHAHAKRFRAQLIGAREAVEVSNRVRTSYQQSSAFAASLVISNEQLSEGFDSRSYECPFLLDVGKAILKETNTAVKESANHTPNSSLNEIRTNGSDSDAYVVEISSPSTSRARRCSTNSLTSVDGSQNLRENDEQPNINNVVAHGDSDFGLITSVTSHCAEGSLRNGPTSSETILNEIPSGASVTLVDPQRNVIESSPANFSARRPGFTISYESDLSDSAYSTRADQRSTRHMKAGPSRNMLNFLATPTSVASIESTLTPSPTRYSISSNSAPHADEEFTPKITNTSSQAPPVRVSALKPSMNPTKTKIVASNTNIMAQNCTRATPSSAPVAGLRPIRPKPPNGITPSVSQFSPVTLTSLNIGNCVSTVYSSISSPLPTVTNIPPLSQLTPVQIINFLPLPAAPQNLITSSSASLQHLVIAPPISNALTQAVVENNVGENENSIEADSILGI